MRDFQLFIGSINTDSDEEVKNKFKFEFLEMKDPESWRILHHACFNGRVGLVNFLLSQKCEMNSRTNDGYQPIHLAFINGHVDIVKILIDNKCDINGSDMEGYQPIHWVCWKGLADIMKILIDNTCDINAYDKKGYQGIHWACHKGHIDIVKIFIENGFDINTNNTTGYKPIHIACENGHFDIVKILISNNCEMNELSKKGESPIEIAEKRGYENIVTFLNNAKQMKSISEAVDMHFNIKSGHIIFRQSLENDIIKNCEPIGSGSFGDVYEYKISNTECKIAIKITNYNCEDSKNIEGNMNKYSPRIFHTNIVRYFGAVKKYDKHHIYMEYISGGSLKDLIEKLNKRKKGIEYSKVIKFVKQILEGLRFLHSQGIIHRDIKPDNMLLDCNETLKLTDFGMSKSLRIESILEATNQTTTYCGTENYLAPEIVMKKSYDFPADIWSTGASIIHMIIGQMPLYSVDATVSEKFVKFNFGSKKRIFRTYYKISKPMLSFINDLLTREQSIRPSAEKLLTNSIFKDLI